MHFSMRRLARSVTVSALALTSRLVLVRYRPKIVMVTGSVGKTSTKDAVAAVLGTRFLVRKSEKSFSSEFGVPFTILGVGNPWGNPVAWLTVLRRALALLVLPNHYPNLLVLEVGADVPGDLAKILMVAKPDCLVVTRLPDIPVHVEFYASPEAVREEEFSPAYSLAPGAPLVVSSDDPHALEMASRLSARLLTYGVSSNAVVRLTEVGWYEEGGQVKGMRAVVEAAGERADVVARGSVGRTQLLPLVAAVAVARAFDVSLAEVAAALESYEPPAGRGRLFVGVAGSIIIDDSYNASPVAVEEALDTLVSFPMGAPPERGITPRSLRRGRRIAVLGDMLELGRYSVMEHERIGTHAARAADLLVTVGIRAKGFATAAEAAGMDKSHIFIFDDAGTAAALLPPHIQKGDIILVKGSQSIRTERIVEALLADPADRTRLVRQESAWLRRP